MCGFHIALASSTGCFAKDVLAKAKASGVVTMGVREASGALSYSLGNGQHTGVHVDVCKCIIANIEKVAGRKLDIKYQAVTSPGRRLCDGFHYSARPDSQSQQTFRLQNRRRAAGPGADYHHDSQKRPSLKKLGDDTMIDMMKSGDMAKLWDKWFMQPIPPKNTRVNFPANASTKAAWANPNDKPAESYAK